MFTTMTRPYSLIASTAILSVLFTSCGESAEATDARKEIGDAIDATKTLIIKTWDDLRQKAEPQIDAVREDFADLKSELAKRGDDAQAKMKGVIADIDSQIDAAAKELEEAKSDAGDAMASSWETLQQEFESAKQAIAEAKRELTKNQ